MTQSTPRPTPPLASPTATVTSPARLADDTTQGKTTIAASVVQKIAGIAAREISGVNSMGGGVSRAFGAIRERIPGGGAGAANIAGVQVEVGEKQAAVDLDIVVEYGASIVELARAVRRVLDNLAQDHGVDVEPAALIGLGLRGPHWSRPRPSIDVTSSRPSIAMPTSSPTMPTTSVMRNGPKPPIEPATPRISPARRPVVVAFMGVSVGKDRMRDRRSRVDAGPVTRRARVQARPGPPCRPRLRGFGCR